MEYIGNEAALAAKPEPRTYATAEPTCPRLGRLSALQKWILVRANQNADAGSDACITFDEIKADYYRMPRRGTATPGWQFRKTRIKRYSAVSNAISRAAYRLQKRRLAEIIYDKGDDFRGPSTAIHLTTAGILKAEELEQTQKPAPRHPSS
jgi:hypothetical protein